MQVELVWDDPDERVVRWQFHGFIGVMDYIMPLNDTATRAVLSDHDSIGVLLDIGWRMPFPNRAFRYLAQAIVAAPPTIRRVAVYVRNPGTRWLIQTRLIQPHPELAARQVKLFASLPQARQYLHRIQTA